MSNRSKSNRSGPGEVERELVRLFQDRGYMRVPDRRRREEEPVTYKKGYEIRFVTRSQKQLLLIRRLLRQVGLKPGKPFRKRDDWIQPVYGRQALEEFNGWLKKYGAK